MDIVDLCTRERERERERERANTKWKFYKLKHLTVFAALLKDAPICCKDSVLHEPLLKNQNVNCLTFEKIYKKALQWQPLPFQSSFSAIIWQWEIGGKNIQNFQPFPDQLWGKRSIKVPGCGHDWYSESEEMLQLNIFVYDFAFVDGELTGELARRSIQKFEKNVKLLRYNNHICDVCDMKSFFKSFRCSTCDTIFSKTRKFGATFDYYVTSESSTFTQRMYTS